MPSEDSRKPGAMERSALRGMSELERLRQIANEHEVVIENLWGELQAARDYKRVANCLHKYREVSQ